MKKMNMNMKKKMIVMMSIKTAMTVNCDQEHSIVKTWKACVYSYDSLIKPNLELPESFKS